MTLTVDGSAMSPTPTPTLPLAMRFGRWALFIVAVAAAAVMVRQASDVGENSAAGPAPSAEAPIHLPPDGAPAAAIMAAPQTADAAVSGALDRSYAMASSGNFSVDVMAGDIKLTRAPGSQARIVVELEPGAAPDKLRIIEREVSPGVVHVSIEPADKDGGSLSFFGGHVRLGSSLPVRMGIRQVRVEVPAGVHADLSTGAGDVDAADIAGDVTVECGAGDIAVQRAGAVEVSTGAGNVSLSDVTGNVHVESGAGNVEVNAASAPVQIETGAGEITVRGANAALDLESGMGSIKVRVASVSAPIQAATGMGSIDVTIDGGGFDLDAASGMGSVAITTNGQTERSGGMGGELNRSVGGGGQRVKLESGAGSIEVHAPTSGSSRTAT